MVKSYLRYAPGRSFGVITSSGGNLVAQPDGRSAITPALQDVMVVDVKRAEPSCVWRDESNVLAEVSCIAQTSNGERCAVGYTDGSIRIWSPRSSAPLITFRGHKSAVTALAFDPLNATLASGSQDTDIVLWDVIAEAGKARLKGHKDQVTSLVFIPSSAAILNATMHEPADASDSSNSKRQDHRLFQRIKQLPAAHLVSSSKDTTIKAWDLTANACIETVVTHRSEVWSLAVTHMWQDSGAVLTLVSGGEEFKVHKIDVQALDAILSQVVQHPDAPKEPSEEQPSLPKSISYYGDLKKASTHRCTSLKFSPCHKYLVAGCVDTQIQIFKILSPEDVQHKLARRRQRLRAKASAAEHASMDATLVTLAAKDEINAFQVALATAKVRSLDTCVPPTSSKKAAQVTIMASLVNNSIETFAVNLDGVEKQHVVDAQGHRGDIRALALSNDDELLASAGTNLVKVWNAHTGTCIRTMECGYALCVAFVPGGKYMLVGTKSGDIEIFSLASSALLQTIKAHKSAIWSVALLPDKTGFVTGSADSQVKFWDFALVGEESKHVTAVHTRTLKLSDEVLAVAISPNQKLLAVSLLDATVKLFYFDSLKFSLSLYGHKLPVLCMDISSDSTIIATGSADKNIKIWGLDFGDCHRSIFAHSDSIMQVKFSWGTHYLFSCSKDKSVKYWDMDKFQNITTLVGHTSEVWALAVGKYGNFVVSASHDRSIRIWNKTDEQLFLEEERDREMDQAADEQLVQNVNESNEDGAAITRSGVESLKAGDRVIKALEILREEHERHQEMRAQGIPIPAESDNMHLKFAKCANAESYVQRELGRVRLSDLEAALLVVPFSWVPELIRLCGTWANQSAATLAMACRVLFFLLRVHHKAIVSSSQLRPSLEITRDAVQRALARQKDTIGWNMAACKYILNELPTQSSFQQV